MGFAASDGLEIHYECFGAGPAIVLVHGWGSDLRHNWVSTGWVDALSGVRRVIALDCRGHGRSSKPYEQAVYGYRAMSRDVIAVMDHAGVERADFLGYSLGSFMGICLLVDHGKRFRSMILGGIGDETEKSAAAGAVIAAALRAKDPKAIADPIGRAARAFVVANPDNDLEALALSALEMWPEGYPLELAGPRLKDVDVPVLVVNGSEDQPYARSDERLVAAIPGARLVRLPGANHTSAVTHRAFRDAALDFLRRV